MDTIRRRLAGSVAVALTLSAIAVAEVAEKAVLHPLPSVVSGTLEPPVLSLDGRRLKTTLPPLEKVLVNEERVKPQDGPNAPLYHVTQADRVVIVALGKDGKSYPVLDATLPGLASVAVVGGRVELRFGAEVRRVVIDGQPYPATKGVLLWDPPREPLEGTSVHVVEMRTAKAEVARIYNLEIERGLPDDPDRPRGPIFRVGAGLAPVGYTSRLAPEVHVGVTWRRFTATLHGAFRTATELEERTFSIGLRAGYRIFHEPKRFGRTWLETGVWGAYLRYPFDISGPGFRNAFGAYQVGLFARSEPLAWERWSLAARLNVVLLGRFAGSTLQPAVEASFRF